MDAAWIATFAPACALVTRVHVPWLPVFAIGIYGSKGGTRPMALIQKKTPEQRATKAALKEQRQREAAAIKEAQRREKERQAFLRSPAGQARLAYERGDHVFQYSIDVMSQQAVIVNMVGSMTTNKSTDPTAILNSVCDEGWELVNGSFVFLEQGQQSRDKFLSSGQNVAIKGTTIGYYLFKRCEPNKRSTHQVEADAIQENADGFERATQAVRLGDLEGGAVLFRQLREEASRAGDDEAALEVDRFLSQLEQSLSADELAIFKTYFDDSGRHHA
jgi:hypothetical protein